MDLRITTLIFLGVLLTFSCEEQENIAPNEPAVTAEKSAEKPGFVDFAIEAMHKKYGDNLESIDEMNIQRGKGVEILSFTITLADKSDSSIMYVNDYRRGGSGAGAAGGDRYEIDCTGTCACIEQYHIDTNTSSCSCDECKMLVSKIE